MDHHWKNYLHAWASLPISLFFTVVGLVYVTMKICDVFPSERLVGKCIFARGDLAYDIKALFNYRNPYSLVTCTILGAVITGVMGWI